MKNLLLSVTLLLVAFELVGPVAADGIPLCTSVRSRISDDNWRHVASRYSLVMTLFSPTARGQDLSSENERVKWIKSLNPKLTLLVYGRAINAANWSNGYLPAILQGTQLRAKGSPILDLTPPAGVSATRQRKNLDLIAKLNTEHAALHPGHDELAARMDNYELAFHMQTQVPEVLDLFEGKAHVCDFHVTLLRLVGLDDNKHTFYHAGRFKQLSQFGGTAIKDLIA